MTLCELEKPGKDQIQELLAFIGGLFKKAQLSWSTSENKGVTIYQIFEKLHYLLLDEQSVRVFSDPRNFLFVFAPLAF